MTDAIFRHILVPTDFSPQAERAWAAARRLARTWTAEQLETWADEARAASIASCSATG